MFLMLMASTVIAKSLAQTQVPKEFVNVHDLAPTIQVDLRYLGEKNFVGRPIAGYKANKCYVTRKTAEALLKVQSDLLPKKMSLLIFDCYRPQKAVDDFMTWARDMNDQVHKAKYYPKIDKSQLIREGYIASKSGHSRGSTVDLTLVHLEPQKTAEKKGSDKNCAHKDRKKEVGLDMGTNYDCFDELSHTLNQNVSYAVLGNRKVLKSYMEKRGFANYEKEWWHFTLKDEPFPDKYFDFDIE